MRKQFSLALAFLITGCLFLSVSSAFSGNKEMVEKNVRELDSLNQEVMQQIPELPGNANVHVKARIKQTETENQIDIFHTEIFPMQSEDAQQRIIDQTGKKTEVIQTRGTGSSETVEQEITFGDSQQAVTPQ